MNNLFSCVGAVAIRGRILSALITILTLLSAGRVEAQTFTNVFSLDGGSDGDNPQAGLVVSGNTLYGTTANGGASSYGTVFAVNIDGTGYTNLYSFANSDGANPVAGLVLSGNTLYGTTANGGASNYGTVFSIGTNGMGFSNLYSFSYSDGANPQAGLILSGNTLFGTTQYGGNSGAGTVFCINTDSTDFTNLYNFTYGSDGAFPMASLVLSGNTLYGTAQYGGDWGAGTVFAVSTDGFTFSTLYSFTNGSDGSYPVSGLTLLGSTLYGTVEQGGSPGYGTVFSFDMGNNGFKTLYSFTNGNDGAYPAAGLVLFGNSLYGTTEDGGGSGWGAIFAINTNGLGFTNVSGFLTIPAELIQKLD